MTPFEKAKDLIDRFARMDGYDDSIDLSKCEFEKQCALVVVDEIIEQNNVWISQTGKGTNNYWQQVKQEIINL
jgi:hypothetical protein